MIQGRGEGLIAEIKTLRWRMVFVANVNLALSEDIMFHNQRLHNKENYKRKVYSRAMGFLVKMN